MKYKDRQLSRFSLVMWGFLKSDVHVRLVSFANLSNSLSQYILPTHIVVVIIVIDQCRHVLEYFI